MLDILEKVENKYKELTDQLSDPSVLSEPSRLQKIARERAGLEQVVQAAGRYRQVLLRLEEDEKLSTPPTRSWRKWPK